MKAYLYNAISGAAEFVVATPLRETSHIHRNVADQMFITSIDGEVAFASPEEEPCKKEAQRLRERWPRAAVYVRYVGPRDGWVDAFVKEALPTAALRDKQGMNDKLWDSLAQAINDFVGGRPWGRQREWTQASLPGMENIPAEKPRPTPTSWKEDLDLAGLPPKMVEAMRRLMDATPEDQRAAFARWVETAEAFLDR